MSSGEVTAPFYAGDTFILDVEIWNDADNAAFDWSLAGLKADATLRGQGGEILFSVESPGQIMSPSIGIATVAPAIQTDNWCDQIAEMTLRLTDPTSGVTTTVKTAKVPILNTRSPA